MSIQPNSRETRLKVPEFKGLELSELEAKLRELERTHRPAAGSDERLRLRHELGIQEIMLELQRRELEVVRQERDEANRRLDAKGDRHDARSTCRHITGAHPAGCSSGSELGGENAIEQQIRLCDDFSRAVLNALPAQLAVLDGNGSIIATNDAWLRAAGESDAPPVVRGGPGDNYLQLQHDLGGDLFSEAPLLIACIESMIEGTQPEFKLEYANHTASQRRWFLVCITPMAGEIRGAVVANVDITARVLAQEDVQKRGEEMASAARLSSVGILASALAHEITQPLTSVGQFSSAAVAMLSSGEAKPQDLAEVLLQIDSEVQRAGEVMRRLKVFMSRGAMRRQPVDMRKVFDTAIGMVRQQLADQGIELVLDVSDVPLGVIADQVQLTQVVVNLLYNSIEAIGSALTQERQIRIDCRREPAWIHVRVFDTGPGIPPEWGDSIFDLFAPEKSKGAGMGLAISRSIIEDHGGKLWAESESTAGAIFHFTLPAMQEEIEVE
jgi:C4-dicarboxylate-specific signal transduction histidine kinase